jgi:hypothetical protein
MKNVGRFHEILLGMGGLEEEVHLMAKRDHLMMFLLMMTLSLKIKILVVDL